MDTRSYTVDGVTVNASAWSRTQGTTQTWAKAWLGAYSGGHGVTDSGEGSGSGNTHTMDNNGRDNYIVYQFSSAVNRPTRSAWAMFTTIATSRSGSATALRPSPR